MKLFEKIIDAKTKIRDEEKEKPHFVSSMDYFKSIEGKNARANDYVHWFKMLNPAEKKRILALINEVDPGVSFLNVHLDRTQGLKPIKVKFSTASLLPAANLITLRYKSAKSIGSGVSMRATGFVMSHKDGKGNLVSDKLDVIVIKNDDLQLYRSVDVFKQFGGRCYVSFGGFTSYELDKTLLTTYAKADYGNGRTLKDLKPNEFSAIEDIIDYNHNMNLHRAYDYEANRFRSQKTTFNNAKL